jgi:hypothetical protein
MQWPEVQVVPSGPMKKRRLADKTMEIMCGENERRNVAFNSLIKEQEDTFHTYENEIYRLTQTAIAGAEKHRVDALHITTIQHHLTQTRAQLQRHILAAKLTRTETNKFISQIDELSMRVYEAESTKDELEGHYKDLVKGLQKTSANAEEASAFMRFLHKTLNEYRNGEKCEDLVYKTSRLCTICMSEPANILAKPCHHLEWCRGCAIDQFELSEDSFDVSKSEYLNSQKECPRCKAGVECIDYVYI